MPIKPALAEEAAEGFATLLFDGDAYTLPASQEDVSLDFLQAYEDNQLLAALKALIGPEQYAKFRTTHKTVGDLTRFMKAAGERMGGNF